MKLEIQGSGMYKYVVADARYVGEMRGRWPKGYVEFHRYAGTDSYYTTKQLAEITGFGNNQAALHNITKRLNCDVLTADGDSATPPKYG